MTIWHTIDHTLLRPEVTEKEIVKLCMEAVQYQFYSVCINPIWVKTAKSHLMDKAVKIVSVAGFPLGTNRTDIKIAEAEKALQDGADEIDMVISIGHFKEKNYTYVLEEIQKMKALLQHHPLKVIVETCLLTELEKVEVCKLVIESGADFIKTSTGFNASGAKVEDVLLFHSLCKNKIKIKASGGIGDYLTAVKLLEAGASRLGTSKSLAIVSGFSG